MQKASVVSSAAEAMLPSPSAQAAQLDVPERAIYMVFLTIFIDILAATISTPVMPFYAQMFNATNAQIGYLFAAWSFCSTFFAPVLGGLSDKYGRRPILITALLGAGVANICQGLTYYSITYVGTNVAFYIFGFFRAFSGVWAAIGTVTNVYIADVVPKPLLSEYMAKMSIVGPLAFVFGPGMGGGLAAIGGNNLPVLADGLITLLSAFLVGSNLPETPAFLKLKAGRQGEVKGDVEKDASPSDVKIPFEVYLMSAAAFFGGLTMSAGVSMQAIFLNSVYKFDVLHVTYVMLGSAVSLVLTGMFLSVRVKNKLGLTGTVVTMNTIGGLLYFVMAFCGQYKLNVWYYLTCVWLNSVQGAIAGASTAPLLNDFAETSNRGKINSINQLAMNFGRMVGPLMYGHIADHNINIVWVIAGGALLVKSILTSFVRPKKEESGKRTLNKLASMYGPEFENEVGTDADFLAIGKHVGMLLEQGHYKWMSRRSEIETLFEHLLPPLNVDNKEDYYRSLHQLEMAVDEIQTHSKSMVA